MRARRATEELCARACGLTKNPALRTSCASCGAPRRAAVPCNAAAGTLGSTENRIEGIKKNRLPCSGLTGEHREARAELQFKTLDQSNVLQQQTGEHVQPCDDADRSGSSVRLEGVSDIPMN